MAGVNLCHTKKKRKKEKANKEQAKENVVYQILKPIRKPVNLKQQGIFARICSQTDGIE